MKYLVTLRINILWWFKLFLAPNVSPQKDDFNMFVEFMSFHDNIYVNK